MIELAIGAEGTRSLDFLAPAVYTAAGLRVPRIIYFEDTTHNDFHNHEVEETLDGFLGLSSSDWLANAPKEFQKVIGSNTTPNAALVVESYLRASGFKGRFDVIGQLPTARQLSVAILRSLAATTRTKEVHFRKSRTCLRLANASSEALIEKAELHEKGGVSFVTTDGGRVDGDEKIICQGDYAILKTLIHGTPGYVPWYQKPNPKADYASFEAYEIFTPLYSARINRRAAMHTHDLNRPLAYGYFWNFEKPTINSELVERDREWEPSNLTKRICELIASPQREMTVRRRAAHDVIEGLITSATITVHDYLSLAKDGRSPVDEEYGGKLFQLLALLKAGREEKKAFQTEMRGERSVASWERQTSNQSLPYAVELKQTQTYLKCMDDLTHQAERGSTSREILKRMAIAERDLKEVASVHVEALWSWAEKHYRWSAGRSLVSEWFGHPKRSDNPSASRIMVSLRTAKTEIVE